MKALTILIAIGGVLHLGLLTASALVPRVLDWRAELKHVSALTRQLVWVHGAFIVLVIIGFAVLSLAFAPALAAGTPLARGVCGFIAIFWATRLVVHLAVFDTKPYLTTIWLKLGERGLVVVFAYFALVYGFAALWPAS